MHTIDMRSPTLLFGILLLAGTTHAQLPRLWGMTPIGGANNKGTIFRIDGDGTDFTVEFNFDDDSGYSPEGTLCLAPNGKFYGTTNLGGIGSPAAGTLFSFDPAGGGFEKLVDFNITNGGFGWGGMILADDGMLYGATYGGGGSGGSIYRLDPSDDEYTILYPLDQTVDGSAIADRLMQASDDMLYGVASMGGVNNAGTIFRYDLLTSTFTKLHDFDGAANGLTPYGVLCEADNGWFYGTTWEGGTADEGTLFKYDPATDTFEKLIDFIGDNGQSPWTAPVRIGPDQLYGTVALGGSNGAGVIYSLIPSTDAFTEEYSFNTLDGGLLFGSMTLGPDGKLYGMGSSGGANFLGTVYSFDPATAVMTTLHSFDMAADGYGPRGDLVVAGPANGVEEIDAQVGFSAYPNPTSGDLLITIVDPRSLGGRLTITNGLGQVVDEVIIQRMVTDLHMSGPPGVYVLKLATPGSRTSQLVVVQ